ATGRFAFVRVVATHPVRTDCLSPRWEWLIIEWPERAEAPTDYWLSNLPDDEPRERLAPLAPLPSQIPLPHPHPHLPPAPLPPPPQLRPRRAPLRGEAPPHPERAGSGARPRQKLLLLQPVPRCWTGRCRTCNQTVNLNQLPLFHRRE